MMSSLLMRWKTSWLLREGGVMESGLVTTRRLDSSGTQIGAERREIESSYAEQIRTE